LSVGLGALSVAVLLFTSTYHYYEIYEAMHDNFVTYFVQALPVLWVVVFVVLMGMAMRGFRATKRGYRFSPWLVGGSSVGMSVLLGVVASGLGFGHLVDKTLGEYAPMYQSMAMREEQLWLQPAEGRLVGKVDMVGQSNLPMVDFVDVSGQKWQINTAELRAYDKELLLSEQKVRVVGQKLTDERRLFHACGVFPWLMDKHRPARELRRTREEAIERLYGYKDDQTKRITQLEQRALGQASASNTPSMKLCAEIAAVRRISNKGR
jgi:hypothetical protein